MKLFEYAVIYNPKAKKEGEDQKSELIVPVATILAANKENAAMIAARSIPEKYIDKLDRIEVAVRPFLVEPMATQFAGAAVGPIISSRQLIDSGFGQAHLNQGNLMNFATNHTAATYTSAQQAMGSSQ